MKLIFTSAFLMCMSIFGYSQTSHSVTVSSFSFSPSSLTIDVGDTVVWTNTGGSHNVNGTTATFGSNPDSFGNSVGTGWTYSFKFTIAGNYSYQCDPHSGNGMTGSITVVAPNGIEEGDKEFTHYFNMQTNEYQITFNELEKELTAEVIGLNGAIVYSKRFVNTQAMTIPMSNLSPGMYFLSLRGEGMNEGISIVVPQH